MDWKERCFQLEQQHAAELTRAEESESRLSRTLVQLTLAVGGLDPVLDPHLKSLREAVRDTSGVDTDARLSKITDALIKSGNTSQSPLHTPPINSIDLFHRIRQRIQQQSSSAERLKLLAQEMVSNPATMTDNQLDELLKLLISDKPSSSGKGLLGALLPSTEALSDDKEKVGSNQQLLILLEQQSWPGQLTKEIAELEADLDGGAAEGAWAGVIEKLLSLLIGSLSSIHSEVIATEDFLEGLTTKRRQIDQQVNDGHRLREKSFQEAQELSQVISAQTGGIREGVTSADSLGQLQKRVVGRLDTIEGHMASYIETEEQRQQQAEESEQKLRERLHEVERESLELQKKVIDAHLQATTDSLTGLPNRMAYEERLAQEYARWKRFGEPLTLMMWDVDNFKQINDRFGHQSGDRALVAIGQAMKKRLRETDFIARQGGEEFVVLLTGADKSAAETLADQIRHEVQESGFHSGGKRVEVTASCGLSLFTGEDTPDEVFVRADKALYQAKRQGKNRFVSS
ncbi:MAG: GGDEF domain-containing protein [Sedimenticola sp.]